MRVMMRKILFIWMALCTAQAEADYVARCATDNFGNTVCRDKNGVLTTAPNKAADEKKPASAGKSEGEDENKVKRRCAVDQFGNTVCSEHFKPQKEK